MKHDAAENTAQSGEYSCERLIDHSCGGRNRRAAREHDPFSPKIEDRSTRVNPQRPRASSAASRRGRRTPGTDGGEHRGENLDDPRARARIRRAT